MRKLLVTLVFISIILSTLSPALGGKGIEKDPAHKGKPVTGTYTDWQKAKDRYNSSSHPGSLNRSGLVELPSGYNDVLHPSLGNNHALKPGMVEFFRTEPQRENRRLEDCCLAVGPYDNYRESLEKEFAKSLKEELLNTKLIKYLFVTESPHVLNSLRGKAGIPEDNLIDSSYGLNKAALLNRIASFPYSNAQEPVEIYIIAPHDTGEISLPSGEKIRTDELKTMAKEKGIFLNIWGCNSGWDAAHGIIGEFNSGALTSAIGNALREKPKTRAQFLNALSGEMGVLFSFDVLEYKSEVQTIQADLIARAEHAAELEKMFNHFEVTAPKGYNPCNPSLPRPVTNQTRPACN